MWIILLMSSSERFNKPLPIDYPTNGTRVLSKQNLAGAYPARRTNNGPRHLLRSVRYQRQFRVPRQRATQLSGYGLPLARPNSTPSYSPFVQGGLIAYQSRLWCLERSGLLPSISVPAQGPGRITYVEPDIDALVNY